MERMEKMKPIPFQVEDRTSLEKTLVREIEKENKHPNHSTYKINGIKYVRGKADKKKNNNVNS